jgi:anti-sigma factor ChrR (cupin superfamily)
LIGKVMTVYSEALVARVIPVHDIAWEDAGPGLKAKPLWADPATQRRAYVGLLAPGARLPLHRHLGDELVYVIEGEVGDESGTLVAGQASYRPWGCVHSLFVERGTMVLIVVTGGMEPADSTDSEPASWPINVGQIEWTESGEGIRRKVIWEDPAAGRSMQFVRFDPGAVVPAHRHHGESLVFGIEGEITDEHGSTLPGYFSCQPDGYTHSVRSANGATMLCYTWGPAEPVGISALCPQGTGGQ